MENNQAAPSPEPARLTVEDVWGKWSKPIPFHDDPAARQICAMKEFAEQQNIGMHLMIIKAKTAQYKAESQLEAKDTELSRLRTLIKQVFDLEYDHLSWCEFEKEVLEGPLTDTTP